MVRLFFSAILLVILIFVVSKSLQVNNLYEIIFSFPKEKFIILLLISILISTLKAWRFLILLKNSNIKLGFWDNLKGFIASQAVTPLPGGEAIRGILVKYQTGSSLMKIAGPVIAQAFLDIATASILVLLGSLFLKILRLPALVILILLSIIFIFLLDESLFSKGIRTINKVLRKLPRIKKAESFFTRLPILQKSFKIHFFHTYPQWNLKKSLVPVMVLSIAINILGGAIIFIIANSYGVNLGFFKSIFVYSTGILIQTFGSISPGGLGFTEGGLTGLLLLFNVSLPQSLAIVILFRITTLIFTIFLGLTFLGMFFSRPLLIKNNIGSI